MGNPAEEIAASSKRQAAWVIGQCIDTLMRGYSIHPIAIDFVEDYLQTLAKEKEHVS